MKKLPLFISILCLVAACNSDEYKYEKEEPLSELVLSVQDDVEIDDVYFSFDILEGNGGYVAKTSREGAAVVTIKKNKVLVEMFNHQAYITVSDKKGQTASVNIYTSSEKVTPFNHTVLMPQNTTEVSNIPFDFGVKGNYTLEKIKGTAVEASLTPDGYLTITSVGRGSDYYNVYDKRGFASSLNIRVITEYKLESSELTLNAINDEEITIMIDYGHNGWRLKEAADENPLLSFVHLANKGKDYPSDMLTLTTNKDGAIGNTILYLINDEGEKITIRINVNK